MANEKQQNKRDSSSKVIFKEPVLCAQFLRDYSNVPIFKNVQPEDIEDVSERFVHLFTEDREADTVKKVKISGEIPVYFISLIEHKTYVDYNVVMQILRYMVGIWEDYEKEMNRNFSEKKEGLNSKNRDFRYPFIFPVIYYEGKDKWTAQMELKERIAYFEGLEQYIPNFTYELVQLRDFSNQDLINHQDEISVIMMFNKLQDIADLAELKEVPTKPLENIVSETPEYLLEIMAQVVKAFLMKLNLPETEEEQVVSMIKERNMSMLFENFEKVDIQEERRKLAIERQKVDEERKKADEERKKADEERKKADEERKKADEEHKKADEEHKKAQEAQEALKEEKRYNQLIKKLVDEECYEDIKRTTEDVSFRKQLLKEYNI